MNYFEQTFTDELIVLTEGTTYVDCEFRRCTLHYDGAGYIWLEHNKFDNCRWDFVGPAANTLQILAGLPPQLVANVLAKMRENPAASPRAGEPRRDEPRDDA